MKAGIAPHLTSP